MMPHTIRCLSKVDDAQVHGLARSGWQRCGVIPGYALLPRGGFCDTTYFYRMLDT